MKAGTLYDMLRQFLPNITTRMFTEFYNQGMSKVTREARVSVVETQFDGDTEFGYIGSEAVFIDLVYHDSVKLFYSIENGVLKVRDYTGQEYDKLNGLIVRYHKFFDEAILEEPVEITRNVFDNSGDWGKDTLAGGLGEGGPEAGGRESRNWVEESYRALIRQAEEAEAKQKEIYSRSGENEKARLEQVKGNIAANVS